MKILVVDDEEDILFSLKKGLESSNGGYLIQTAKDGEKCITILREEIPDLILLDLMMPNMNGWKVLDVIQENMEWRDIPIFIISAVDDPEFKETANHLGIVFIEKPISIPILEEKIEGYFNG